MHMKKVIIAIIALLGICLEANAQLYIGGSVYFQNSFKEDSYSSYSITPDIGYGFGDVNVGAMLAAYFNIHKTDGLSAVTLGITPYAEYYFFRSGILSLFVEGGCGIKFNKYIYAGESEDVRSMSFNPYIAPGIELDITDHFSVLCHIGRLEWESNMNELNFGISGEALGLGLYYSF